MQLVVYAEPSQEENPGHMVVGQEGGADGARYFGFRFDPADLPPEAQPPACWRQFLFEHVVPGRIVDETAYVSYVLGFAPPPVYLGSGTPPAARTYYEKRAPCPAAFPSPLPLRASWVSHEWYSFNPDTPPPPKSPCYNCVKWAIEFANRVVSGFLPSVENGRLKRVLAHLQQRPSTGPGAS